MLHVYTHTGTHAHTHTHTHTHTVEYYSTKTNEMRMFAGTRMNLRDYHTKRIKPDRERPASQIVCMWNLKKKVRMALFTKQK